MDLIVTSIRTLGSTALDVLPIVLFIFGFQALVIRRRLPNLRAMAIGLMFTVLGLGHDDHGEKH